MAFHSVAIAKQALPGTTVTPLPGPEFPAQLSGAYTLLYKKYVINSCQLNISYNISVSPNSSLNPLLSKDGLLLPP